MSRMYNPPHPGILLQEELEFLGISASQFARHIGVSPSTITRILKEESPITPDTAVRISAAIEGPSAETWLKMQADYDAWQAEHRINISNIRRITPKTTQLESSSSSHF